jgi:polyisoprenoid-binding protein YceI
VPILGRTIVSRRRFSRTLLAVTGALAIAAATAPALPAPVASAASDGTRVEIVPGAAEARFKVWELLAGRVQSNQAIGATRDVSGAIVLDAAGMPMAGQSAITVDLRTLTSDSANRDRYIKNNTLEVNAYPTATIAVTAVDGMPWPLPTEGEAQFQLTGDLTIHGVTQPSTWQVAARFGGGEVAGRATTVVRMTDFGMTPPRVGPVVEIQDETELEIDFRAAVSGGAVALAPAR